MVSVKISSWVWHEASIQDIKGNDLVLLLALADVANDKGVCTFFDPPEDASYDGLAAKARIHRSTIADVLSRLKSRGVLEVTRQGPGQPNRYRLLIDQESGITTPSEGRITTPRVAPARLHSSPIRSDVFMLISDETSEPATTSSRRDSTLNAFEEFWSIYPRKVGKVEAEKAFVKAAQRVAAQVILAGARRFAADPNLPEKQYVAYPATWLNRGSWDDEPLPERADGLTAAKAEDPYAGRRRFGQSVAS